MRSYEDDIRDRITDHGEFLIGHHRTLVGIEGFDWQILMEAEYIVNAAENGYGRQNINHFIESNRRTESGKRLARSVFCLNKNPED